MKKRYYVIPLLLILFNSLINYSFSQERTSIADSLKLGLPDKLEVYGDSIKTKGVYLKLPKLNPTEKLQPQFSPYDRLIVPPIYYTGGSGLPHIHWDGVSSSHINIKSSTVIARTMPSDGLIIYSTATLGIVETPFFGKSDYFILNAGANYAISNAVNIGIRGGYDSDFGYIPTWNAGIDANIMLTPSLMIDGGLTYISTAGNTIGVSQSAIMVDLHGRYKMSEEWYLNAYGGLPINQRKNTPNQSMLPIMNMPYFGGSVEHWFKPSMGVEGGVIWSRDAFTGKMRARPKVELLFKPGK